MAHINGEITIDRPVQEVFDFVADECNEPRYNPRMLRAEKLSPGPIGRGTRFRAEAVTLGRTTGMTIEYTIYERPRRLASSIHMPAADIADPVETILQPGSEQVAAGYILYGASTTHFFALSPDGAYLLVTSSGDPNAVTIAVYVDPRDDRSIAAGMTRLVEDAQLRERVAVDGPAWTSRFSWSVAGEALRNLYHAHDRQG